MERNSTHRYIYLPSRVGWKWIEQMQHNAFYGGISDGWGPGFKTLVRRLSKDYTHQHDCLKSMNES